MTTSPNRRSTKGKRFTLRHRLAVDMRRAGKTFAEIGRRIGRANDPTVPIGAQAARAVYICGCEWLAQTEAEIHARYEAERAKPKRDKPFLEWALRQINGRARWATLENVPPGHAWRRENSFQGYGMCRNGERFDGAE